MSIASAIENAQAKVAAAYSACNGKGATMPAAANQNLSNLATTIGTISAGGGVVEEKDVNFRDYDGTLVASYTAAEFANLSALPANPSHAGLTAQGWNWTLADAKTHVAAYGRLEVGQMYITSDGKTRLYISIKDAARMNVPLYWSQTVENGVEIDWGDGSATETVNGTTNLNTSHNYGAVGDYVISLYAKSGTLYLGSFRTSNPTYSVMGATSNSASTSSTVYRNMLKKVEIGDNITSIGGRVFYGCYSLASITIPSSVTSIGEYVFYSCYSLASVVIPRSVTSIENRAFYYCHTLTSVVLPNSLTSIGTSAVFTSCYALGSVVLPNSLTSIGANAFSGCYSLASITIPSSVTSIGNSILSSCHTLTSVVLPNGLTSISQTMFDSCHSLASLVIPSSVTSIGSSAFYSNYALKSLTILNEQPPQLGGTVFSGAASDLVIYVPSASVATYKAASGWSDYADKIQAMPQ